MKLNYRNNSVSPINQLLVFLRFCASGSQLISVGDFAGMHLSTVSRIIKRVASAIAHHYNDYIKFPQTVEEIREVQTNFSTIAEFPRVIEALDCTHVKIQSPGGEDEEMFRNRKTYFSINVQVICDANLLISNVVSRWPGASHDNEIFNNSHKVNLNKIVSRTVICWETEGTMFDHT